MAEMEAVVIAQCSLDVQDIFETLPAVDGEADEYEKTVRALDLYFQPRMNIPYRNRNRNLKTSKALLKSQAHQGTSLFTSAATNQRGVSKGGSREAQVRIPEYQEGTE